jgi:hypothetical protein
MKIGIPWLETNFQDLFFIILNLENWIHLLPFVSLCSCWRGSVGVYDNLHAFESMVV